MCLLTKLPGPQIRATRMQLCIHAHPQGLGKSLIGITPRVSHRLWEVSSKIIKNKNKNKHRGFRFLPGSALPPHGRNLEMFRVWLDVRKPSMHYMKGTAQARVFFGQHLVSCYLGHPGSQRTFRSGAESLSAPPALRALWRMYASSFPHAESSPLLPD